MQVETAVVVVGDLTQNNVDHRQIYDNNSLRSVSGTVRVVAERSDNYTLLDHFEP